MTVKNRILMIRLSEKLDKRPVYSKQLGVTAKLQRTAAAQVQDTDGSSGKERE